jgi:hypothetical protein
VKRWEASSDVAVRRQASSLDPADGRGIGRRLERLYPTDGDVRPSTAALQGRWGSKSRWWRRLATAVREERGGAIHSVPIRLRREKEGLGRVYGGNGVDVV